MLLNAKTRQTFSTFENENTFILHIIFVRNSFFIHRKSNHNDFDFSLLFSVQHTLQSISLLVGPPLLLLLLSWLICVSGEVSPTKAGSGGIRPSFIRFFCFIRRFWNQIFTWKIRRGFSLGSRVIHTTVSNYLSEQN